MKEKEHYISLTLKGSNAYHQKGERLRLKERIVSIGEHADCDVRYEADGLMPEYYAAIIQNEDGKSWRIVKRSQHVNIQIAGKGAIGYAHQLEDGDLIRFSHQPMTLCFHQHYDNHYDEVGKKHYHWQWVFMALLAVISITSIILGIRHERERISFKDVEPLEKSVYMIRVDSVCRILKVDGQEQMLQPMKECISEAPTGTAFLTADSKMITARHCVEYWIGRNLNLTTKVAELNKDDIIRWAIETETFNQTHQPDSMMQLRVFFSLYDFMGNKKYSFVSTDSTVHINTNRDGVFMLADFRQNYYWRSVRPYFTDRQMELGDILWIEGLTEKGNITIAHKETMNKIKAGTPLMICGYPVTGIGDKRMMSTEGFIRRKALPDKENLFLESNINHGFSGGPVFMRHDDEIVAIGVISRVDSISSGLYKWAVPITEVDR